MATAPVSHGSSVTADISYTDLYARWERGNWSATEIDFSQDKIDWHERMTEQQRTSALWFYNLFFHGEDAVTDELSPYIDAAPLEEQKYFLATQQVDEARHSVFFKRFMDEVVGLGDGTMAGGMQATEHLLTWGHRKVFEALEEMTAALRKDHSLEQLAPRDHALPRRHRGHARPARPALHRDVHRGDGHPARLPRGHPQRRARRAAPHRLRRQAARRRLPAGPRDGHARGQRRDPRGRPVHVGARQAAGLGRRLLPVLRLHLRASSASRACARSSSGSRRSASTSQTLPRFPIPMDLPFEERAVRGTKMLKANLIGPERPVVRDPEAIAIMFDAIRRQANSERRAGPGP